MYPSKHDRKRYRYTLKCFNTVKRLSTVRRIFSLWFEISFAIKWQHLPERVWTDRTWNKAPNDGQCPVKNRCCLVTSMNGRSRFMQSVGTGREKRVIVTVIMLLIIWGFFNKVFFILKTGGTRTKYRTLPFLKRASFRLQDLRHSRDHLEVGQLNSNR